MQKRYEKPAATPRGYLHQETMKSPRCSQTRTSRGCTSKQMRTHRPRCGVSAPLRNTYNRTTLNNIWTERIQGQIDQCIARNQLAVAIRTQVGGHRYLDSPVYSHLCHTCMHSPLCLFDHKNLPYQPAPTSRKANGRGKNKKLRT